MMFDSLVLGAGLPPGVPSTAQGTRVVSFRDDLEGVAGLFTIELRDDRVASFDFSAVGEFEELARVYDRVERALRARHGEPSWCPPREDEQRHVPLFEEGLPCDRYWRLRSVEWAEPRVDLLLYERWPADVELTLRARADAVNQ
jgi:hypothetical protein